MLTRAPHKGLKSPKRFTNLPLGSMSSILNLMGLMHSNRSSGVHRTLRSYNMLIEVFKFIWNAKTPIRSDPFLSQSHQDWGFWTFSSKVAECALEKSSCNGSTQNRRWLVEYVCTGALTSNSKKYSCSGSSPSGAVDGWKCELRGDINFLVFPCKHIVFKLGI